jgi:hypothetical protein
MPNQNVTFIQTGSLAVGGQLATALRDVGREFGFCFS